MKSSKRAEMLYQQGRRHLYGDGVAFSYEEATIYLKKAADLGHTKAQYNLGICLHQGTGIRQSYQKAYEYFQKAAKQSHPRSHYMLGCYSVFGFLSPPSEERAAHYFQLAADAGIADAQYDLAVLLLAGKSEQQAIHYFKLAAAQGNADAEYNLGVCYYHGLGVSPSRDEAIRYLEQAVRKRQSKAAAALEVVIMAPSTPGIRPNTF